jgi:hypothetical protein
VLLTSRGRPSTTTVRVRAATGAEFDLGNPANRVRASLRPPGAGTVAMAGNRVTVTASGPALLTVTYQRELAAGDYRDVANTRPPLSVPVHATIPVIIR